MTDPCKTRWLKSGSATAIAAITILATIAAHRSIHPSGLRQNRYRPRGPLSLPNHQAGGLFRSYAAHSLQSKVARVWRDELADVGAWRSGQCARLRAAKHWQRGRPHASDDVSEARCARYWGEIIGAIRYGSWVNATGVPSRCPWLAGAQGPL